MSDVLRAPDSTESPTLTSPTSTKTTSKLMGLVRSPIGKKLLTGITGLGLTVFVLVHMLGNLLMFVGTDAYNAYAYHLEQWGIGLYAIEAILLLAVLVHAALGIQIFASRLKARPRLYSRYTSAGGTSYQTVSSRTMIITGTLLAAFLVSHLMTFKFGPRYPIQVNDLEMRDLARLVVEEFQQPFYLVGYTAMMALLGLHLRHGIWSAFQSLGALGKGIRPLVFTVGTVLAAAIAVGFVVMPWAIYFGVIG